MSGTNPYVLCFLRERGLPESTLQRDDNGNLKRAPDRQGYPGPGVVWTVAYMEWCREKWRVYAVQKFVRILLDLTDDVELTDEHYGLASGIWPRPLPSFFSPGESPRSALILRGVRDVDASFKQWLEKNSHPPEDV